MSLTRDEYDALVALLSWLLGFSPMLLRRRWTWLQGVGLALLLSPFVRMGIDVWLSLGAGALFTYTVLVPVSRDALWASVQDRVVTELLLPGVGLLLLHNATPGLRSRRAPPASGPEALAAEGIAPRASVGRDLARGLSLFLFIAAAYVVSLLLDRTALAVLSSNGSEAHYWKNVTVPLIVLLSGTAGLAEELLFRGVLLSRLARVLPWWLAAVAQAAVFALVHAGYGTWSHVVGPLAFGLGMAWVARRLGVLVTATLHAEVNVVFFAIDVAPDYAYAHGAWGVVALISLVGLIAVGSVAALAATRADGVRILWDDATRPVRRLRSRSSSRSAP